MVDIRERHRQNEINQKALWNRNYLENSVFRERLYKKLMELSGDSGEVFACKLRGSLFEIWETDDLFDVFFSPIKLPRSSRAPTKLRISVSPSGNDGARLSNDCWNHYVFSWIQGFQITLWKAGQPLWISSQTALTKGRVFQGDCIRIKTCRNNLSSTYLMLIQERYYK